ncbi:hypothetical protein HPP92_013912 [Vanilla planifolia]|uniref:Methyltransferase n=1 Tax=Vanilla planifolia TaxID=51239 RepID=A0A835R3C7_VANPL|nr:hypothetical protein HPP92_013912 [Vanilla planifolia]
MQGRSMQIWEKFRSWSRKQSSGAGVNEDSKRIVKVKKFQMCPASLREYIPCLDNEEAIKKLNSTERGEKFERHCPEKGKGLNCLIPSPNGYKTPIPWPKSRDEVWFNNVPHTRLVEDKGGQNWITRDKDKFKFPGGGTQFIHGADQYLNQISEMVPDIAFGSNTRVVLDVGCGVASFGAYLFSKDVITMSIAPKDVHENQIQFALERGVPAMVAAFATHRLLYPSQAFDLIHCSRCRINWTRDDGILLLEVDRMLRAGGYFAWAAQPVYKHEEAQQEAWKEMEDLTSRICWELVKKEGYLAIWRKALNNTCYDHRDAGVKPLLCDPDDEPDNIWYVSLKPCISRLPENGFGINNMSWPSRLHVPPLRLQQIQMDASIARKDLFKAETAFWDEIVGSYDNWYTYSEILYGSCSIHTKRISLAYRCEPFDTYPRTYDLLHAFGLFSREWKRCNITIILLEMDRILRPGGHAYIRDSKYIIDEVQAITKAMGWRADQHDTSEDPCLMSSSVYYGGRDYFIPESTSSYKSGNTYNFKNDKEDDSSKLDFSTRGEWWQDDDLYLEQLDVKIVFDLAEIHVEGAVVQTLKAFYQLKQAQRHRNEVFNNFIWMHNEV